MSWLRLRVRQGSLLALFALVLQFVLSFGHFHAGFEPSATAYAQEAIGERSQTATPPLSAPDQHPDGLAANWCTICATIALSGALIAAAPPALPLPEILAIEIEVAIYDFVPPDLKRAAFQPRAPPHS